MLRVLCKSVVSALIALSLVTTCKAERFLYTSYSAPPSFNGGRETILIDTEDSTLSSGDSVEKIDRCIGARLDCVVSASRCLYLPKVMPDPGDSWKGECDGFIGKFRLARVEEFSILGVRMQVSIVSVGVEDARTDSYYLNLKREIVAMRHDYTDGRRNQFFVIQGNHGYSVGD